MPYRARAAQILEEWRAAERGLEAATTADDRAAIQLELERLKREYRAVFDAARAAKMPEPPAFPGDEAPEPV